MGSNVHIGTRLREERDRLGLDQMALATHAGIGRKSQYNYEMDERAPDATYLAAIAELGIDVRYVVTGKRDYPLAMALSPEEKQLVTLYRHAPEPVRVAVIGALTAGASGSAREASVVVHGDVGQQVAGGVHAPQTFNMGKSRRR